LAFFFAIACAPNTAPTITPAIPAPPTAIPAIRCAPQREPATGAAPSAGAPIASAGASAGTATVTVPGFAPIVAAPFQVLRPVADASIACSPGSTGMAVLHAAR